MGQMCVEGNGSVRRPGQGSGRELMRVVLLLAVLHSMDPSAATTVATTAANKTLPVNITIHVGKRAEFRCGATKQNLTFIMDDGDNNTRLNCTSGEEDTEDLLNFHEFKGQCVGNREAVWTVDSTAMSHNGYNFICQLPSGATPAPSAFLTVYDDASKFGIIVGCTVGAFCATLLFFAVAFRVIKRSERLQQCFRGEPEEVDNEITMVSRE